MRWLEDMIRYLNMKRVCRVSCVRFSPNVMNPVIVSVGWDKVVKVSFMTCSYIALSSSFSNDVIKIFATSEEHAPMRPFKSPRSLTSISFIFFFASTCSADLLHFHSRFGNFPSSSWRPTTMVTPAILTLCLSHPMVRLLHQVARTESRCCGILTRASTCTLWRQVTLSMPLSSLPTVTGCVPLRRSASKSSTWRAST